MYCFRFLRLLATTCFFSLHLCLALDSLTFSRSINDSETLVSQGSVFRFGFFSPVNSTIRYVGIWFNKSSPQTVVWVANKNNPINNSLGVISISNDGNLVVTDGKRRLFWSTNFTARLNASSIKAQLMDSGNLVLRDNNGGQIHWESFNYPSNSFLPGMKLGIDSRTGVNQKLTSWKSLDDPSPGDYSFGIAPLKFPEIYLWEKDVLKWRSGPWNGQAFIGSRRNPRERFNGFDLYNDSQGTALLSYKESSLMFFFKLEPEGVIHEEFWNKEKEEWTSADNLPAPPCNSYGKCGEYAICSFKDKVPCKCIKGFVPKDKTEWKGGNWSNGCVRKGKLHCEGNKFMKLEKMKVPVSMEWSEANEKGCKKKCVDDCSCMAYAIDNKIGCMIWRRTLLDLQDSMRNGIDLYIRVASSSEDSTTALIIKISIGITTALVGLVVSLLIWHKFQNHRVEERDEKFPRVEALTGSSVSGSIPLSQSKLEELPLFEFQVLATATENFALINKLGQGGFGSVYKGKLQDGQEIAVKRLSQASLQGLEELMNEVVVISKLQHRNLVKLLGCCIEGEERMLVYEFMPMKSLDGYLFGPREQTLLDWKTRFNILNGICRGLLYLHRDSRLKIIHRDLKVSNILLDEHMNPKISDFGIAKIFHINEDVANTSRVVGTLGYMSPEYAMRGLFSEKSDVFSLGVIILEIVSGGRNSSFYNDDKNMNLLDYAWKLWKDGEVTALIDPRIYDESFENEICRCVHIGLLCVQDFSNDRPCVSTVIRMLDSENEDLPDPKQPAFIARRDVSDAESFMQGASSINHVCVTSVSAR